MISLGGVGPAPGVGGGVKLRLTHFAARLAEEDVVVGVGIKGRVEIDEIDARFGKFPRVAQPPQIVAEVETVHRLGQIDRGKRLAIQAQREKSSLGCSCSRLTGY